MNEAYMFISLILFFALILIGVKLSTKNKEVELTQEEIKKLKNKLEETTNKYSGIISVDEEIEKATLKKEQIESDIVKVKFDYRDKKEIYDSLIKDISIYDEELGLIELGFYKPHFDFDTSEKYKEAISSVKSRQKSLISSKTAIYCNTEWAVEGSKAKGRTMTNRAIRITARAFNNECDVAIGNVRWNNIDKMEQRITKAYDSINKLNESTAVIISREYMQLKLDELRLAYEYAEKKQNEKEEQAEIKRQIREEAKLEAELAKTIKEEEKYKALLDKAKKEAESATGKKLDSLNNKITQLNSELLEAHTKSERAKSMAQQTRTGHVYVISNIGSFGENVYKIGMTRRLEPLDRVKELGDASVPFTFDVHAMIHSDDAPALEKALHKEFDLKRLNMVNYRKEFFNVNLSEIKRTAQKFSPEADFIETAEARDYRETQKLIAQHQSTKNKLSEKKGHPEFI